MNGHETHILITGGSGVLGGAVVEQLHDRSVTCLVHRNRDVPSGVDVVQGDLRQPAFGLAKHDYEELASRATHIIHCAAATSFAARPDVVTSVNAETTSRVLEFAERAGAQTIHVSTAFVNRTVRSLSVPAVDMRTDVASGINAYVLSKKAAEHEMVKSGLPVVIIRPSLITGHSITGTIPRFQGIHLIPKFLLDGKLPLLPADRCTLIDFLPRDIVAEAVVAALDSEKPHTDYWVTAGAQALRLEQVVTLVESFGVERRRQIVSPRFVGADLVDRLIRPVFLEHLPGPSRRRFEFLLALLELFESAEPFPSDTHTLTDMSLDLEAAYVAGLDYWASVNVARDAELSGTAGNER